MKKLVSSSNLETVIKGVADAIDNRLDGKSFKYLTTAEFEELSSEEKNRDDIVYQITDAELSFEDIVDVPDFATKEYVDQHGFSGDYNDLTNRPCYEESSRAKRYSYNSLTDTNLERLDIYEQDGIINALLKISDDNVSFEEVNGKTIIYDGVKKTINESNVTFIDSSSPNSSILSGSCFSFNNEMLIFVNDPVVFSHSFPSGVNSYPTGIWLSAKIDSDGNVSATPFILEYISENIVKQLDEKFIPDTIARKSDVPNITIVTQAEYDAIEGTDQEDSDTFYLISDEL